MYDTGFYPQNGRARNIHTCTYISIQLGNTVHNVPRKGGTRFTHVSHITIHM